MNEQQEQLEMLSPTPSIDLDSMIDYWFHTVTEDEDDYQNAQDFAALNGYVVYRTYKTEVHMVNWEKRAYFTIVCGALIDKDVGLRKKWVKRHESTEYYSIEVAEAWAETDAAQALLRIGMERASPKDYDMPGVVFVDDFQNPTTVIQLVLRKEDQDES